MMRTLVFLLLLGAPALTVAQSPPPKTGAPESFSGLVQAKNATGGVAATLDLRVARYTPEFDRKSMEEALRLGGSPRFLTTLRCSPEVGQLVLAGSQPYAIRYAREKVEGAGRTIVLITDKPVFFLGSGQAKPTPKEGYEVAVVEITMDGAGQGKGIMAAAARVRPDGAGGVLLDDYADAPITVTKLTRKPS